MKSVFIIYRSNYYRYFSRIIETFLNQDIEIQIWCHESIASIDLPFSSEINKKLKILEFHDDEDLSNQIKLSSQVDYFFSLHPFSGYLDREIFFKIDNKWMMIMHGIDSYIELRDWHLNHTNKFLEQDYKRHYFPYARYIHEIGIDWLQRYKLDESGDNCNYFSSKNTSIHFSKAPFTDENSPNLELKKIKEKYCIDSSKKVLVYLPFPFSGNRFEKPNSNALHQAFFGIGYQGKIISKNSYSSKIFVFIISVVKKIYDFILVFRFSESRGIYLSKNTEQSVVEQVRKFCDKNNYFFIVKSRKKFGISKNLAQLADLVIAGDDNQQNPSEFQEISKASDLIIGYTSTAVFESIFYKSHFVNISFPSTFYGYGEYSAELHNPRRGYIYNYPGTVTNFLYTDFIEQFESSNTSIFSLDKDSEESYRKRFIGEEFLFDNKDNINKITKIP